MRARRDLRALSKLRQRNARIDRAAFVEIVRQKSVDDEPPVEGHLDAGEANDLHDRRRAVGGQRIVEPGGLRQLVRVGDIFDQHRARDLRRRPQAVELDALVADGRAKADDVALVGGDDDQRTATEEIRDRRELAALQGSHLDRPGEELAALEFEADDRMRDFRARPEGEEEIDGFDLRQIVAARRPALRELGIAAPVEIAHVLQRQNVAVDDARGLPRDVRRPVAVGPRMDRRPPRQHQGEGGEERDQRGAPKPREQRDQRGEPAEREEARREAAYRLGKRHAVPKRKGRPECDERDGQRQHEGPNRPQKTPQ